MPTTTEEIRQSLLEADPEFRRLAEEHSRCESQLEMTSRRTLPQFRRSHSGIGAEEAEAAPEGSDGADRGAPPARFAALSGERYCRVLS